MSRFVINGRAYGDAVTLSPPPKHRVPVIPVHMAFASMPYQLVIGKLDTGADRTMLPFHTARALGLLEPTRNFIRAGETKAANGSKIPFYVHEIWVYIVFSNGQALEFQLQAGFSNDLRRTLFGKDWLKHLCIAIDRNNVHLLRD